MKLSCFYVRNREGEIGFWSTYVSRVIEIGDREMVSQKLAQITGRHLWTVSYTIFILPIVIHNDRLHLYKIYSEIKSGGAIESLGREL